MFGSDTKVLLALLGAVINVAAFIPYLIHIARGSTRPHAFSWLIWGTVAAIGFAGQQADGAGAGSWITCLNAVLCYLIVLLSMRGGMGDVRKIDYVCLALAIAALPLWMLTSTPLWSIVVVTFVDAIAFLPTVRKSLRKPFEETATTYLLSSVKFAFALAALERYTLVTVLYPLYLVGGNLGFVVLLLVKRKLLGRPDLPARRAAGLPLTP